MGQDSLICEYPCKGERWKDILLFLWKALRPLEGPVVQRAIASI